MTGEQAQIGQRLGEVDATTDEDIARVTTEIAGSAAAPLITRMRGNADGPPRPSAAFQPAFASPFRRGGSAASSTT